MDLKRHFFVISGFPEMPNCACSVSRRRWVQCSQQGTQQRCRA